jgi:hypothetical protein
MQRASLNPLEAALALAELRRFHPEAKSARNLSELTGLALPKIKRLLRLAEAPETVQAAVGEGILIPTAEPDDDRPENERKTEQRRTLDLLGALEFARLHAFLFKKCEGQERAQQGADTQTREAIQRALKDDWGLRQIQHFVEKATAGESPEQAPRGRPPRQPFKKSRNQLVIYPDRLAKLSQAQKSALRALLEPIWKLVSDGS